MSFFNELGDGLTLGFIRRPLKQATGLSDMQIGLAAAAAATGGAALAGGGAAGGSGLAAGGGLTGMTAGGGAAGMTAAPGAILPGAASAAPASSGLLGTVNQSLLAANAAKGLLGGQQAPMQAPQVMPSQGGPQALQGLAMQGDQVAQQRMQSDEQARMQRRLGLLQGGMGNGRFA